MRVDPDKGTADGTTPFCWAAWQDELEYVALFHAETEALLSLARAPLSVGAAPCL